VEEYLNQLNESQREAVLHVDGPELVIAGAGSGKTRVLTYKIAYLLDRGLPPYTILSLTFTNKAAKEMKERIAKLTDPAIARRLWMGTFHSIFSRILRKEAEHIGYRPDFTIYDSDDSKSLIKTIIKEMGLDDKQYRPGLVQSRISQAKNSLVTSKAYEQNKELVEHDMHTKVPRIREIYARYQNRCFQAGAMDFDDLLLQTNILFRDHPDVLAKYSSLFQYILVDEYQDTNFAQHLIVQRLQEQHHRICVVGDDAQSIYSFRGANIENILQFKNQYPNSKVFKLERNYRSTQNIVGIANSLINKNKEQIHKDVYSEKEKGNKIRLFTSFSDYEEAYIVASQISERRMGSARYAFTDFAVLYRTNAQSRVLEEALRKRNIPYRVYGGFSFYQRKEIKDIIAYLRLLVNPFDEEALKRVINYPMRGIGNTTASKLTNAAVAHGVSPWEVLQDPVKFEVQINSGTLSKLTRFREMIERFAEQSQTLTLDETAALILEETGILKEFNEDRTVENISRKENVQELLKGMIDFTQSRFEEGAEQVTLSDFLSEVSLYTDQDNDKDKDTDKITLMTVHASKGLEFKNVFVVGLEEELFPSTLSKDNPRAIEEERRLFYVAITRAEDNCTLTYAKSRYRNGQSNLCSPSRFLGDLDMQYIETQGGEELQTNNRIRKQYEDFEKATYRKPVERLPQEKTYYEKQLTKLSNVKSTPAPSTGSNLSGLSADMRVQHDRFGTGTVVSTEGDGNDASAIIEFDNLGSKRLILKYARLTIL
jgi:DNA helicase-2/ATP-dependent DNA helicase PcrA